MQLEWRRESFSSEVDFDIISHEVDQKRILIQQAVLERENSVKWSKKVEK